jgi:hypothetical protein
MGAFKSIAFHEEEVITVEPLAYFPKEVELVKSHYVHNGEPALLGVDKNTRDTLWIATVQIPDHPCKEGHIWLRSTGIYTGMLEALARINVIKFTGRFERVPGSPKGEHAFECKLLM